METGELKKISLVIYIDFMLKQYFVKWNTLKLIIFVSFKSVVTRKIKMIYIVYIFLLDNTNMVDI